MILNHMGVGERNCQSQMRFSGFCLADQPKLSYV
jgi:hypothetical protein